jgi:aspartate/methionine/tyrosine aminotransferase
MLTLPTHSKNVKFSSLVKRIGGDGADAWLTHYEALAARERGEDVIILSVGDPDLDTPPAVIERAVRRCAGDTHYAPAAGRRHCARRLRVHAARSGCPAAHNVVRFRRANALFILLCIAGPGTRS